MMMIPRTFVAARLVHRIQPFCLSQPTPITMWPILFRDVGLVAKKSYALIESRQFSFSNIKSDLWQTLENERQKLRRRTDEEWHLKRMAIVRMAVRRMRENNPNLQKESNESHKERYATNPRFRLLRLLSKWTRAHEWVREELPWKSHRPVVYTNPVQHRCESCGLTRRSGLLLVWQSIAQPDLYSCHTCYLKHDLGACMPEGYEDVRDFKELARRKKRLEKLKTEAPRAGSTADGGKDKDENHQAH
jgi:hypothetical protein